MSRTATIAVLVVACLLAFSVSAYSTVTATIRAYLYAFPLVLMEKTRQEMLAAGLATNTLNHATVLPSPGNRAVVRPNNDTLYSVAWLDLSLGAQVVSVPSTGKRYYVVPFYDAWTNVFATIGTRSTGNQAGEYAIVGPDWAGEPPKNMKTFRAPTNMVWVIARLQIDGKSDLEPVKSLQQGFRITSLERWQRGERSKAGVIQAMKESADKSRPSVLETVNGMDAQAFFSLFNKLVYAQAPAKSDDPLLDAIRDLGVGPRKEFSPNIFTEFVMNRAFDLVRGELSHVAQESRAGDSGWAVARTSIGRYGTDYRTRAFVALIGLGALPPAEAMYPNAEVDRDGEALTGSNSYRIHFNRNEIPPVSAFWSLTVYDELGFLVENPIGRYAIGDRDDLEFNEDGSLDILLQHSKPASRLSNWLPTPKGKFAVTMRLYLPGQAAIEGHWQPPPIQKSPLREEGVPGGSAH